MSLSYDVFAGEFLAKIQEFDFAQMEDEVRIEIIDGYLMRALAAFRKNCRYDLFTTANAQDREFDIDIEDEDLSELVDIVSEGMVIQWMKPMLYRQENLENVLNTRDFTLYSPANLLYRIREAYTKLQSDYTQMIREYSYNHGDLTDLHT